MKSKAFLTSFLLSVVTLYSIQLSAQDATGAELMKQSQAAYFALEDMTADYTLTVNDSNLQKPLVMKGTLKASKEKFYANFPEASTEQFCDGDSCWSIAHNENMVVVTEYDARTAAGPNQFYSWYESGMEVVDNGTKDGIKSVLLVGFPKDADISKVELQFNEDMLIQRAIVQTNGSTFYESLMLNIKTNTGLNDDTFKINRREWLEDGYYFID